jgi:hypothetical protein
LTKQLYSQLMPDLQGRFRRRDLPDRVQRELDAALRPTKDTDLFADFIAFSSTTSVASSTDPIETFLSRSGESRPELWATAQQCFETRLLRTRQTDRFIDDLYKYDVPLGQSPEIKSDSLLKLLETSKNFCVAPLAIGGAQAVTQLSQGHYASALLTTGTGSAMTLILISTISVGAFLVQRVAQARAHRRREEARTRGPRMRR